MGYQTRYVLKVTAPALPKNDPLVEVLGEKPRKRSWIRELCDSAGIDNPFEDACKWYEHEEDLKKFSKQNPGVRFDLECRGEDGEQWREVFFNGKVDRAQAVITYAEPPATFFK